MKSSDRRGFAYLVALHDDVEPQRFFLKQDLCVIGRSSDLCDITIARKTISRIHAQIENKGSHYILQAMGRNPTYVESSRVEGEHVLHDGDRLGFATPDPILRFLDNDPTESVLSWKLVYDEKASLFLIDKQEIHLTPMQFRLLLHLYQNAESVCTRESCARAIWRDDYFPELEIDNLDKVVSSLRKRLARFAPDIDLIENRRGLGYIFHNY